MAPYIIISLHGMTQIQSIQLWNKVNSLPVEAGLVYMHRDLPDDRPPYPAIAVALFNSDGDTNMDFFALLAEAGIPGVALVSCDEFDDVAGWTKSC